MPTIDEACQGMEQTLTHIQTRCQVVSKSLTEFENHVCLYVVNRICLRLWILVAWIAALTRSLYEQHKGCGHVYVFLTAAKGTTLHWVENEKIVADKAWFQSGGLTVLSFEESIDLVKAMVDRLAAGDWQTAVDWLNKYGKSPGLDFDELCQIPFNTLL